MNTDYADRITQSVTMPEVCEMYGLPVDRGGFTRCPFHGEKTASMKIYPGNRGWYCFGCHNGGNVLSFVQLYFGLPFRDAMQKINQDFNLGLPLGCELDEKAKQEANRAAYKRRQELKRRKRTLSALRTAYNNALERYVKLDSMCDKADTAAIDGGLAAITDEMAYALRNVESAWYELCEAQTRLSLFEHQN